MNIPESVITKYFQLKSMSDTAFTIFRKDPSTINAAKYTTASNELKTFCVEAFASILDSSKPESSVSKEEILSNIDQYKTCKQCGDNILYQIDDENYIASSDFLPEFPGWCYICLTEHCSKQDCRSCTVAKDPATCSFRGIKEIQNSEEEVN